jgi:hypothetical protein
MGGVLLLIPNKEKEITTTSKYKSLQYYPIRFSLTAISHACWGKMKPTIEQRESVRFLHPTAVLCGTTNNRDDAFFLAVV